MNETLRIADIQTSPLLYFDPGTEENGYKFCCDRNIDCLPSLDNSHRFLLRDDELKGFREEPLEQTRIIDGFKNIFSSEMIDRFRVNHLLFVYTHEEISGVIHFSDYNKPIVSSYLYKQFSAYEKALRDLLVKYRLNNLDMFEYFELKATSSIAKGDKEHFKRRIGIYKRQEKDLPNIPVFQSFYLDDLIGLIKHKNRMDLSDKTTSLRNHVMHAHDFINMEDTSTEDFLYKFSTFEDFFDTALLLQHDLKRVLNRVAFLSGDAALANAIMS